MRPIIAIVLIFCVVFLGFRELKSRKEKIVGLSTWAFALLPFTGLMIWILSFELLWFPLRLLMVGGLVTLAGNVMLFLYRRARKDFKE